MGDSIWWGSLKDAIRINDKNFKAETKRILVGFGDIHNFAPWAKRSSTSVDDFKKFILFCHERFTQIRKCGYYVKLLADGLMFIRELPKGNLKEILYGAIKCAFQLNQDIENQIKTLQYPRPDGFRVRIAVGDALKLTGFADHKTQKEVEYIGYIVNLAFRLLEIQKNTKLICHESVKDLCLLTEAPYLFKKIQKPFLVLSGVDEEDLDDLWEIKEKEKK